MIEKRLVQWYAADAGVDLDIAEREITLAYILRVMAERGLLARLAFKGGTAIRKLYLGNQGRFSLDLDFTALGDADPEAMVLDIASVFQNQTYQGITFALPAADYYANPESCGAEVTYRHDWVTNGHFGIQISFRAQPLLPVRPIKLRPERYFEWLGIELPEIPSLGLDEIVGEKIRAAAQRSRVRDLYDLYQLANLRFNRSVVRSIAVLKCWETNFAFDPASFLKGIVSGQYDWGDLSRLVHKGWEIKPEFIVQKVQEEYAFLNHLTADESLLAGDPYQRKRKVYKTMISELPGRSSTK